MSLPHEVAFVALISSAQLLTQAGLGMVLAPEYIIGHDFGVKDSGLLSWYAAAYSLTVGTFNSSPYLNRWIVSHWQWP